MYTTSDNSNEVEEVFRVVSVYPVEDVESTVGAQSKQVVAGDGLCLTCLADHEQLWQDGHRLQVYGERPQNLHTNVCTNNIIKLSYSGTFHAIQVDLIKLNN